MARTGQSTLVTTEKTREMANLLDSADVLPKAGESLRNGVGFSGKTLTEISEKEKVVSVLYFTAEARATLFK